MVRKKRDAERFYTLIELTRSNEPQLLAWLSKRPLRALELHEHWPLLLAIVSWLKTHPRPGIYLRQVDISMVHSKFIETHRAVLIELLDLSLPPEAIDFSATGISQFPQRYGFLDKPLRIRFRFLDPEHNVLTATHLHDITLDAHSFTVLNPSVSRVFITENEINFLAFPMLKKQHGDFWCGIRIRHIIQSNMAVTLPTHLLG